MLRTASMRVTMIVLALTALPSIPCDAQQKHSSTSIAVGATWLDFGAGWGGDFGAVTAQLRVSRWLHQMVGGEFSTLAVMPLGGASAIPG